MLKESTTVTRPRYQYVFSLMLKVGDRFGATLTLDSGSRGGGKIDGSE